MSAGGSVVALCGGIGGAKLALGLYRVLPPGKLTLIVNIGDDFEHLGLHISPDVDTVLYTLSGLSDPERGWGRAGETWQFMHAIAELGGETWFQLGDRDLAMHVMRTRWLAHGSLSGFVQDAAARLGIACRVLPATDSPVRTTVVTDEGDLAFQRYFVERRCEPAVRAVRFDGAASAAPSPEVSVALASSGLRAIVVCPSNPYLSIDPIIAVPGIRAAIAAAPVPVVCVSPIIGGAAVKGPTAKIMSELGTPVTNAAIAAHYHGLIDGLVIDHADAAAARDSLLPHCVTATLMRTLDDRERLAREVLAFADRLADEM
jgi:LPPG:FO 2-phospho-L-lactate transferase